MLTISLRRSGDCGWSICRRDAALFSHQTLGQAIGLARVVACDEHRRLREPIHVEMPGNRNRVVLARYTGRDERIKGALMA